MINILHVCSFFPNVLQPPIAVVCNTIHGFFVRMGICRKVVRRFDMSNAPPGLVINLPGIDPHDSERRRFVQCIILLIKIEIPSKYITF